MSVKWCSHLEAVLVIVLEGSRRFRVVFSRGRSSDSPYTIVGRGDGRLGARVFPSWRASGMDVVERFRSRVILSRVHKR